MLPACRKARCGIDSAPGSNFQLLALLHLLHLGDHAIHRLDHGLNMLLTF